VKLLGPSYHSHQLANFADQSSFNAFLLSFSDFTVEDEITLYALVATSFQKRSNMTRVIERLHSFNCNRANKMDRRLPAES